MTGLYHNSIRWDRILEDTTRPERRSLAKPSAAMLRSVEFCNTCFWHSSQICTPFFFLTITITSSLLIYLYHEIFMSCQDLHNECHLVSKLIYTLPVCFLNKTFPCQPILQNSFSFKMSFCIANLIIEEGTQISNKVGGSCLPCIFIFIAFSLSLLCASVLGGVCCLWWCACVKVITYITNNILWFLVLTSHALQYWNSQS